MKPINHSRGKVLLIIAFGLALAATLFFGTRFARRVLYRPSREPIKAWMTVPQVARAYGIPPPELYKSLGITNPRRGDRRPLTEIAQLIGTSTDDVITVLEKRVSEPPPREPPGPKPPGEDPNGDGPPNTGGTP